MSFPWSRRHADRLRPTLTSWLADLCRDRIRRSQNKRRRLRATSSLETLEDRTLLATTPLNLDFVKDAAATAPGFETLLSTDVYTAAAEFGWLNTAAIEKFDTGVGNPDDLRRDYHFFRTGSRTFRIDLPDGDYDVTLNLGSTLHRFDRIGVIIDRVQVDQLTTLPGEFLNPLYTVTTTGGKLELTIERQGGTFVAINGLSITAAAGAPVVTAAPTALTYLAGDPPLTIDSGLTVSDADNADLTGATVSITAGHVPSEDVLEFTDQLGITGSFVSATGVLTLSGTASVANYQAALRTVAYRNSSGTPAFQTRTIEFEVSDGTNTGSDTRDVDVTALAMPNFDFDFVKTAAATAPGFTTVLNTTAYNPIDGFGWLNTAAIEKFDTGVGNPNELDRDYSFFRVGSRTFRADLPDGDYEVTVHVGSALHRFDRVGVIIDGVQVDQLTTLPGSFVHPTYTVTVSGGLEVTIERQGGTFVAINALEINPITPVAVFDIYDTDPPPTVNQGAESSGVQLYNGSIRQSSTDLEIPGRGFSWSFERTYRSDVSFDGPLGHNWEFNYQRRLRLVTAQNLAEFQFSYPNAQVGDILHLNGSNRADFYLQNGTTTPNGYFTDLVENPDGTFRERQADGMIVTYRSPDADGFSLMSSMTDRDDNVMTFEYDAQNRLVEVVDTLGRRIDYLYSPQGLLDEVRDFAGRSIRFEYDGNDDLIGVTSPTVTGTPNGNDFPTGKTKRYTYTTGSPDVRANHRLLTITAPNEVANGGPPRVMLTYDPNPPAAHIGRVLTQTIGGTNGSDVPSGGTITYDYQALAAPADPDDVTTATRQTTVTDRNGNITEYQFNQFNNVVRTREFNNRGIRLGDSAFYETSYEWNSDYQLLQTVFPLGNVVETVFDVANPDRFQQGNMLGVTQVADSRGGDQNTITTSATWEPIYNQVRTSTEARGNDPAYVPPNGGVNSPDRYSTTFTFDYQEGTEFTALAAQIGVTVIEVQQRLADVGIPMGLGDLNGDGITNQISGHVIRIDHPSVSLLPGSNQEMVEGDTLQEVVELFTFNQFGQLTRQVDPEGNVTAFDYFPENDPDGDDTINNPAGDPVTGGYLRLVGQDTVSDPIRNSGTNPQPTNIRTQYSYDSVGNIIREVDGRGIATDYVVNERNQIVQVVRAAGHNVIAPDPAEPLPLTDFQYVERFFYDANDNVVLLQTEDRGNTSNVDGNPPAANFPANVPNPDPVGGPAFVDRVFEYDILDNLLRQIEEVENGANAGFLETRYRYDGNENRVLTILPEGNATTAIYDERDLLFRSTRGALTPPELDRASPAATAVTLLGPTDPNDYNVRGGVTCQCTTFRYDANGNVIEIVDADDTDLSPDNNSDIGPGDRTRFIYDGHDRQTSTVDSVGNQTVHQYDPAGNVVRTLQFGPVGGPSPTADGPDVLPGPVSTNGIVQSGNLVNSNLLQANETLYDELNRVFQSDSVLFVNTIPTVRPPDVADGANDIGKGNLTPGDNQAIPGIVGIGVVGRVTNQYEYDRNSRTTFTVEDDEDTYRYRYDGVNRLIETIDPEGNRVETAYDDNSNVIEVRETDVAQVAGVADEIFLTTFFYDSLNRVQQQTDNIGQTFVYRYDSRDNLVATADAQGPLTGATITRRAFADGPLTVIAINDFGNVTRYFYDGISRKQRDEIILTASGSGDGGHAGASLEGVKDDAAAAESFAPTPDAAQGGGDGLIRVGYTYDDNSLVSSRLDDNGNVTLYLYDNLNRQITETKGLTVGRTQDGSLQITLSAASISELGGETTATLSRPAIVDLSQPLTVNLTSDDETEATVPAAVTIPAGEVSALFPVSAVDDDLVDGPQHVIITASAAGFSNGVAALSVLDDESPGGPGQVFDPRLNKSRILGAREVVTPTAATINDPATIPAFQLDAQLAAAQARLDVIASLFPPLVDHVDDNPPTTIVYGYDPDDNVLILEDENDSEVFTMYDALNRGVAVRVFRAGQPDSHVGDPLFAPNPISDPSNPSVPTTIVGTRVEDYQYDGLSRLVSATDNNDPSDGADDSVVTYAYDSLNRVIEETQQIGANSAKATSTGWRAEDLPSSLTYPDDRVLEYSFDDLDRLQTISDVGAALPIVDYDYIGTSRVLVQANPENGTRMTYLDDAGTTDVGYDGLRRTVQLRHLRNDNSLIVGFNHTYDRANNKLTEAKLHDSSNDEVYTYDSAYRLVNFARPNPGAIAPEQNNWTLDGAGNWSTVDGETREHSSFNEITVRDDGAVTTLQYDDNRNLLDDGTSSYSWDYRNRLRQAVRNFDGLTIAEYTYDALGRRIAKSVTNSGALDGTTNFYYDGWRVVVERDGTDVVTQQYVYGNYIDEVLVMDRNRDGGGTATGPGDQRLYHHQNSLFSTYALTDVGNNVLEGYQYGAYGQLTVFEPGANGVVDFGDDDAITVGASSELANPYLFTGRRLDAETDLYNDRSRYLDLELGRFISHLLANVGFNETRSNDDFSLKYSGL